MQREGGYWERKKLRTTIRPDLYAELVRVSEATQRTVSSIVNEAIGDLVRKLESPPQERSFPSHGSTLTGG